MSHILIVGCGPAGISAALRLAERGQQVTLASAKPPIYHRCAGLPGIDLPEDAAQELRSMGAQSLSGHEVMHALSRQLLRYESSGNVRFCPYHRLLRLAVGDGRCVGGVLLNEHAGTLEGVGADAVLLASGGMHTMFSENRFGCDGLAATLAFQAGAALRNPDQLNTSGRYPVFEGGLITSWDGETTVPGLYAAGECADGTAVAFPFSQALATGAAAADYLCESLPEADPIEAGCAVNEAVNGVQQLLDIFRRTRGTRAPAAVERRIRETVQRTMTGGRTARLLQRGLLDIRVMRQQAGRGGYDLGEGLYPVLRLPSLLQLLEIMLTTAAYRLLRQDGDLTAVLRDGKIDVTAKRSAAVEAAAYVPTGVSSQAAPSSDEETPDSARDELIGVGSALQSAAENEFAAQYKIPPHASSRRAKKEAPGTRPDAPPPPVEAPAQDGPTAPALKDLARTEDTVSFQPIKALAAQAAKEEEQERSGAPVEPPHAEPPADEAAATLPEPPAAPTAAPMAAPAADPRLPAEDPVAVPATALPTDASERFTTAPEPSVTGAELIFDPTPGGDTAPAAESAPAVFSTENVLEHHAPHPQAAPAEPEEAPARRRISEPLFMPDPEALLALATARKEKAAPPPEPKPEPVPRTAAARYSTFEPDPESLLSREE